jgi:hypothetical protein
VNAFIEFLLNETQLNHVSLPFPHRQEVRYLWGSVSPFLLALTLRTNSYLSHYTASFLHELTINVPKVLYVNREQLPPRLREDSLDQKAIDIAFRRQQRVSHASASYAGYEITLIESMGIEGTGIIEMEDPFGNGILRLTNIERTLIDITVRPNYAGGPYEVLDAYKRASTKVSINRLLAILKAQNYIYPYHQAIGFYLEKSKSYNESIIARVKKMSFRYDFYLMHGMKEMSFSQDWRLYYPKGF